MVVAKRLLLVPVLKEPPAVEAAEQKELIANKQEIGSGRIDVPDVQETDKFGEGMTLGRVSEKLVGKAKRKRRRDVGSAEDDVLEVEKESNLKQRTEEDLAFPDKQ